MRRRRSHDSRNRQPEEHEGRPTLDASLLIPHRESFLLGPCGTFNLLVPSSTNDSTSARVAPSTALLCGKSEELFRQLVIGGAAASSTPFATRRQQASATA